MLPKQSEIEIPLLKVLAEQPQGEARPQEIYPRLEKHFPQMTAQDREEQLESGGLKWTNRVQWVRQALVSRGEMASPQRGVWAITDAGRARVMGPTMEGAPPHAAAGAVNFVALYEEYVEQFRENLLERLLDLKPQQFEHFAQKLLSAFGFVSMHVTSVSHDGGIDGHGLLKIGLARMRVAFQCK